MTILIAIAIALFALVTNAQAYDGPTDYNAVVRQCGSEWRASDARKSVPKGEGSQAWQAFRKDCVAKAGYLAKRDRKASDASKASN